jgi:rhodanese-related sulfurtransferase
MEVVNKYIQMINISIFRKYRIAIAGSIILLLIIIIRVSGWNRFTITADDLIKVSPGKNNIVLLTDNKQNMPVVDIRNSENYIAGHSEGAINIPIHNLLSAESRKILKKNKSGIILYSDDMAMLIRAWSLLDQMGYRNVFIAANGFEGDEILKYKFRPDSLIKPE